MELLASICNKESAEGKADPGVYLYRIETGTGRVSPVPTEHPDLKPANGITGLCRHEGRIAAVRQHRPNQIALLDPVTCALEEVWSLERSVAGHSLVSRDGALYLVATGLDTVLRVTGSGTEEVVWHHGEGDADTIHCNSITLHQGRLHISGFGPKKGKLWSSADDGFVLDVESGERAVSGIYHPHTAMDIDGVLHWCESSRTSVCNTLGQRLMVPEGYCRGLAVTEGLVCVGISTGRKKSESTGQPIDLNVEKGRLVGACRLHVYARDRRDISKSTFIRSIDLSAMGNEIYDLLALT